MFLCFDAVISAQTMNPKGYQYQCALSHFSLSPSCSLLCVWVCVWWGGVATQTEATLISVLESNLACVQNGSLYQLGGSLPCLESGGSSSSSSSSNGGDASLMTAPRATRRSPSPEAHCVPRKDKEETICVLLLMIWLLSIIRMTRINRYHFKGSQGCCVWMMDESLREDSYRFCIDLCITVVYLHYRAGTMPAGEKQWQMFEKLDGRFVDCHWLLKMLSASKKFSLNHLINGM